MKRLIIGIVLLVISTTLSTWIHPLSVFTLVIGIALIMFYISDVYHGQNSPITGDDEHSTKTKKVANKKKNRKKKANNKG
jgi:Na+/H+ antiporter NhaB